jgi:hypothetical protein
VLVISAGERDKRRVSKFKGHLSGRRGGMVGVTFTKLLPRSGSLPKQTPRGRIIEDVREKLGVMHICIDTVHEDRTEAFGDPSTQLLSSVRIYDIPVSVFVVDISGLIRMPEFVTACINIRYYQHCQPPWTQPTQACRYNPTMKAEERAYVYSVWASRHSPETDSQTDLGKDAGGARGISQLKILAELMAQLNFSVTEDHKLRPCDAFDLIGGAGSGG